MSEIEIAVVQNAADHTTPEANLRALLDSVKRATADGASFILCPECAASGYAFDSFEATSAAAEPLDGPTSRAVAAHCAATGVHVAYGFLERAGDRLHNTAVVVGPGGVLGFHRKAHIAPVGADAFVAPGEGIGLVEAMGLRVGLAICYEVRFPELARCQALMGADLLVVLANWPAGAEVNPGVMAPARAAENNMPLIAANRCGRDGPMTFLGRSGIYRRDGTLQEAAGAGETILRGRVAPGPGLGAVDVRDSAYTVDLRGHRRPELYSALADARHLAAPGDSRD